MTESDEQPCYIEQFPHQLPHRDTAKFRPCGHWACDPHTITYYGTGEETDIRAGDYCMVCYERALPGMCPDRVLREALRAQPE
ncbi:MAG TPA: hypothetical protein VFW76_09600 [Ktedonobacterales bacterium]|nr:hypothetical protein [Ktedonobacterales bacterium]